MTENDDYKFMRRCLELASCAEGMTYPNPMVGSVVVHGGRIIGEGFHRGAGLPHAEVNAINSVSDRPKLKESTLYVNLEPCSHFGKTPPCADFIISHSVPRVVIGTTDTSDKVGGKGIIRLREAGIEVVTGVLEKESRWLNRRFFTFNEKKRPWIVLKWAKSSDGFIDIERTPETSPGPFWISGKPERVLVHRWRSQEQSILVGAGTVRADKPRLNVREWKGNNPGVLILSSSGKINCSTIEGKKTVFTHNGKAGVPNAEIVILDREEPSAKQVIYYLYKKGIQSVFVEGGSQLLEHLISNGVWDEARIFTGRKEFMKGLRSPSISGRLMYSSEFEGSTLQVCSNDGGSAY
jgi:diaminohydroxyphosphoribosylaminopyrimidine deaminase/5-amino-6-(5-phosphoribosylamino)uracil reductase